MKSVIPFLSLILVFTSCTTAYKTGQTPDDVYFSPQRPQDEYVRADNKKTQYRYDDRYEDDRYLRMKVRNRQRWSDLDYYYSDPLAYNYYYNRYNNFYYNNPWNYHSYWNYYYNPYSYYNPGGYYNPYGPRVIVVNPKAPVYNRPRQYNLNVFDRPNNPANPKNYSGKNRVFDDSQPSYSAPRNNSGNSLRDRFGSSSSNSNSNPTYNAPSRTQTSSNSGSSNSSSSGSSNRSGGNAPVRKF